MPVVTTCPAFSVIPSSLSSLTQPGQRDPRIAEHIPAVADMALAAQGDDGFLVDEIERAPVRLCRCAEDEQVRAGIVGDDLGFAGVHEVGESRIGISIAGCRVSTAASTSATR